MSNQKKQSFLGSAAILTASALIVKLIGAVYKLPLNNILGGVGKTYFDTAYQIYNLLLTFSTAGLPIAISKLTSQAHAQGRENEKRRIFRASIWLFFLLGVVGTALMAFGAPQLAAFQENPMAAQAIRALAPAVFCVCLLACMRGYTQGQGNMTPTAVSQVLEALCKLGIGLPLAWYLVDAGFGLELGAAGAICGVTVGTVLSMLFLTFYLATHRNRTESLDVPTSSGSIIRQILVIGIPITLGNSALSIINLIDTKIVMGRLQDALLLSEDAAAALNGQYRMAMDMPNMVAAFVYPVTMSLVPFAAAALARQDGASANRIVSSAFRIIAILAFPAGIGLSVLATPIMILVLPSQYEDALAAGFHLQILGIALIFICLMILTNSILQVYGREKLPILTVIIGGITKIVMNYILVGNPGHRHQGRPHLHPVLLSGDRGAEPVLRLEVLPPEAPVSPDLRKAGGGRRPDGRRRLGGVRLCQPAAGRCFPLPGAAAVHGPGARPVPGPVSDQRRLHAAGHFCGRGGLRHPDHRPADPPGGGRPLHAPAGRSLLNFCT